MCSKSCRKDGMCTPSSPHTVSKALTTPVGGESVHRATGTQDWGNSKLKKKKHHCPTGTDADLEGKTSPEGKTKLTPNFVKQ